MRDTGQELTVVSYSVIEEGAEASICELLGEVRNSGRVALPSPNLTARFMQGEVHKGVAQQDISGEIAPGETVRFGIPYPCSKSGDRITFTATVHGEEIEIVQPPRPTAPAAAANAGAAGKAGFAQPAAEPASNKQR